MMPETRKKLADDLAAVIKTLQSIATELAADGEASPAPEAAPPQPEAEPAITEADVRKIMAAKSRDGFTKEVKAILANYGVAMISELDPQHYAAAIADTEAIK
jgi:uncharacterized membrane protein YccC